MRIDIFIHQALFLMQIHLFKITVDLTVSTLIIHELIEKKLEIK